MVKSNAQSFETETSKVKALYENELGKCRLSPVVGARLPSIQTMPRSSLKNWRTRNPVWKSNSNEVEVRMLIRKRGRDQSHPRHRQITHFSRLERLVSIEMRAAMKPV